MMPLEIVILMMLSVLHIAGGQTISTKSQTLYQKLGETADLSCRASGLSSLAHMEWRKRQDQSDQLAWVAVANGQSRQGPFKNQPRYSLHYGIEGSDGRILQLTITGLRPEDEGEYRCEAWQGGEMVAQMVYTLNIYHEIKEVVLSDKEDMETETGAKVLSYVVSQPGQPSNNFFSCRVKTGLVKPVVAVYMSKETEDHNITGLSSEDKPVLEGSVPGLQNVSNVITKFTKDLQVSLEDDDSVIICEAKIMDQNGDIFDQLKNHAVLSLSYKPRFREPEVFTTSVGSDGVQLVVEVKAKPAPISIGWEAQQSELHADTDEDTEDTEGMLVNLNQREDGDSTFKVTLNITTVTEQHIDSWNVSVCNTLGCSYQLVVLHEEGWSPTAQIVVPVVVCALILLVIILVGVILYRKGRKYQELKD